MMSSEGKSNDGAASEYGVGGTRATGVEVAEKPRTRNWIARAYRSDKRIFISVVLLFLLSSVGLVVSYANLTSTATNPNSGPYNSFSTGTVTISDNEATTALFTVSNADPGASGSACIGVQYTGTITNGSHVYLYAANVSSTNSLGNDITFAAQDGTDSAAFATGDTSCATFTPNADTTAASHATTGNAITALAISSWPILDSTGYSLSDTGSGAPVQLWSTNPTTVWYMFSYVISGTAPGGSTANIQLTWEADGQ